MKTKTGSVEAFDQNWGNRRETIYSHWTRGTPKNQIQLAFRQHWLTFNELMGARVGEKKCLEVGCGRGSLSAYYSDDGWDCSLLDISETAIDAATKMFESNKLSASFFVEDCTDMSFADASFDLTFSIGLLEHFEDVRPVIAEQFRVLKPGGLFIGYVVPEFTDNIQKEYQWINEILKQCFNGVDMQGPEKTEVYRSYDLSPKYIEVLNELGADEIFTAGTYPLPMISYSTEFPFSLMPDAIEEILVKNFSERLDAKRLETGENPWLCEEHYGQAFLITGRKSFD